MFNGDIKRGDSFSSGNPAGSQQNADSKKVSDIVPHISGLKHHAKWLLEALSNEEIMQALVEDESINTKLSVIKYVSWLRDEKNASGLFVALSKFSRMGNKKKE